MGKVEEEEKEETEEIREEREEESDASSSDLRCWVTEEEDALSAPSQGKAPWLSPLAFARRRLSSRSRGQEGN